jgi:2,3,4,5-tetrahydropyridine-2-carboxylate N-succinyltransferase
VWGRDWVQAKTQAECLDYLMRTAVEAHRLEVEGVRVGREAVLGANVVLTASTPIIDMTGSEPVEYRGRVPPRAVVVPGTRSKKFPAGEAQLAAALIIGERKQSTDQRTSLNDALRDFAVAV